MTGNRSTSRPRGINVSDKRLVRRQGSRTVTARGSVVKPVIGICSEVFSPGVRGWAGSLGYYSDYDGCSVSSGDDLASVIHGVTLPKAIRYGSARVSAYGGKALNNFNDRAALLYVNRHGTLTNTGRVLKPAIGNHSAQTVGANFITPNGRLRWLVGTINGNYYDVKSYTIHYSYFVLQ
jgi:hypothetical protein